MKTSRLIVIALTASMACIGYSDIIRYKTLDNGPLNSPESWEGGIVPGANDQAWFESTKTSQTITVNLGEDTTWGGAYINALDKDFSITISTGFKLYLGALGFQTSSGNIKNVVLKAPTYLTTDQIWNAGSGGLGVEGTVTLQNHTLEINGGAKKEIKSSLYGPGTLSVLHSYMTLVDGCVLDDVDLTSEAYNFTYNMQFLGQAGATSRAKSIIMNKGYVGIEFSNNTTTYNRSVTNTIAGPITCESGGLIMQITQAGSRAYKHLLQAASYIHEGGITLFRGSDFGLTNLTTTTGVSANLIFTQSAPVLLGEVDGTGATVPIMKGAVADTTTGGYGMGFATYDTDYGVRLLDFETEYTDTITSAQADLTNVRLAITDDQPISITLEDELSTINSLTLINTSTTNAAGITIAGSSGNETLRINSGMIYAQQSVVVTPTVTNTISLQMSALDFNNQPGIIYVRDMKGANNYALSAPLRIKSAFTNVAPEGILLCGPINANYPIYLEGNAANTYTGRITVAKGAFLRLASAGGTANTAVRGTLIIDGGMTQWNNNLDDYTADVILYSGNTLIRDGAWNSGSYGGETFRDFTMFGGSHTVGSDGGGAQTCRDVKLYAGTMTLSRAARLTATNLLMTGTTIGLSHNAPSSGRGSPSIVVGSDMTISNTLSTTQYNPINIAWAGNSGPAFLAPFGGLNVYGNDLNTNSVLISRTYPSAPPATYWLAECRLTGDITFNISDGAAVNDLEMDLSLVDNGTTAGRLIKTGAGTLLLSASTNTLTGGVTINAGTLAITGYFASGFEVESETELRVDSDTAEINGNLIFKAGAAYAGVQGSLLTVNGAVTAEAPVPVTYPAPTDDSIERVLLMTASGGINATFTYPDPKWKAIVTGGNQLWLRKNMPTRIQLF